VADYKEYQSGARSELPAKGGQRFDGTLCLSGVGAGSGAIAYAPRYALQDCGEAEEIEGGLEIAVGDPALTPGAITIARRVFVFRGNSEISEVPVAETG
jgi:hypothetical protein